jgi:hypothetical protein
MRCLRPSRSTVTSVATHPARAARARSARPSWTKPINGVDEDHAEDHARIHPFAQEGGDQTRRHQNQYQGLGGLVDEAHQGVTARALGGPVRPEAGLAPRGIVFRQPARRVHIQPPGRFVRVQGMPGGMRWVHALSRGGSKMSCLFLLVFTTPASPERPESVSG